MKRKSLEFQKIKSKLQQRRKKDAAAPSPSSISTSTSAPTSPGLGMPASRGNSSSNSSSNSGDELEAQRHHLRSPIRPQPPTTPELKMVVAGLEEGAVERKRKQVAEDRSKLPVADGSSSGGDGEEEDDGDSESPSKKRKAVSASTFAQTYTLRLEQAIRDCVNAVKMAEQRLGMPLPKPTNTAPIYYRWSSLARAKYIEPEWQFLSNMSPFPVTIDGIAYPTLEHYYHVMKFVHARTLPIKFDSVEQMRSNPVVSKILSMPDPEKVKQLMGKNGSMGKKLPFNGAAWSKAIPQLMMSAKLEKVRQYPGIRRLLLESGQRTIAERKLSHRKKTPPEPSDIRGMLVLYKGQWYGDNGSGKMWMRVRRQLQQEELERERIAERARTKGKLVLVESDSEETKDNHHHDEAEMQVVEEEVIEELIDGDEDDDEADASEVGTVVITVPVGTKQDYIISHVKDEHVTIAHNPEEEDLRAIREQQQQKQKLQLEEEERRRRRRVQELEQERRQRRAQELEEERKRRRAQEVEEEERRRRRRAQQLRNETPNMTSGRGGEEAAALLRVRRPSAEPQPQPQSQPRHAQSRQIRREQSNLAEASTRRASAPTTATTPSSFAPAEVFREAPTRRSKAVEEEEEEVVEEVVEEEIIEEEILEEEVVVEEEFFEEEEVIEEEVIEEATVVALPVPVPVTRVVERDCFDMSDSDESDFESDSADDSDSDSSDDSSDDGY